MFLVFCSVPPPEAESLAEAIVNNKLAGCVQILPPMTSVYVWEGKLEKEAETLLLIKTIPERFDELEQFILEHHSYEVPEIIAIDAEKVSHGYMKWLELAVSR